MYSSIIQPKQQENQQQDTDEGFIANKILIRNQNLDQRIENQRPSDFQTRFIRGELILKKEPKQLYDTNQIQQIKHSRIDKSGKKYKQKMTTLYELYIQSKQFKMIYSRNKQKEDQYFEEDITAYFINMQHVMEYKTSNYSIIKPYKSIQSKLENQQLEFDSKFQSGNLMYAFFNQNIHEYHLLMQNDVNTRGYNQWFYFSIQNTKANTKYKIKIVNFKKKESLFASGMKPLMFSLKSYHQNKIGWNHNLHSVNYERINLCKNSKDTDPLYALQFILQSNYADDQIFIAMGLPYTYSKLNSFLTEIEKTLLQKKYLSYTKEIAAYTICSNAVPLITITSNVNTSQKKYIGIMARQHPGETWSSFLMQQLILQLLSNNPFAQYLRMHFVFKIFPMINIDGVIYGNFRCDVSGVDLNRQWKYPNKFLHPHIYDIKNYLSESIQTTQYEMFFDLHGHSKKLNTFCYSCQNDNQFCRILPLILQKFYKPFNFPDCTFGIKKQKQNTARAFIHNVSKKDNVLTIQLSFFGTDKLSNSIQYFQPSNLKEFAEQILKSIYVFESGIEVDGISRQKIQLEIQNRMKQFLEFDKYNQNDSGSQSDPYQDQIELEQKTKIIPKMLLGAIEQKPKKKIKLEININNLTKKMTKQTKSDKKSIIVDRKIQLKDPSPLIKNKQQSLELRNNRYEKKNKSRPTNPSIQLQRIIPKIQSRAKNYLEKKRIQFNQTTYKQLQFGSPIDLQFYKNNKIPKQISKPFRSNKNSLKKNEEQLSHKQNFFKKAEQLDKNKNSTIYNTSNPTKVVMPRMAVLHQSIQEPKSIPALIAGNIRSVKRILEREQYKRDDQIHKYENHVILRNREKKKNDIINYEKFKKKSQYEKLKYSEVTKIWKQNFQKYSKVFQQQNYGIQFK